MAASGEARPISRFFDTQEYREVTQNGWLFRSTGEEDAAATRGPSSGKGKAPGREEAQESQDALDRGNP
jgi:hypothetical protein